MVKKRFDIPLILLLKGRALSYLTKGILCKTQTGFLEEERSLILPRFRPNFKIEEFLMKSSLTLKI